jgi:hypothetical protein
MAGLLHQAVLAGGADEGRIDVVLDELEACRAAIEKADKNDLVVLMVDRPKLVWETLTAPNGV